MDNDFCNRCLVNVNSHSSIRAKFTDGDKSTRVEHCEEPTNPRYVKKWATEIMEKSGGDATFELNAWYDALLPVSTWNGDPVCSIHLWECRERETNPRGR